MRHYSVVLEADVAGDFHTIFAFWMYLYQDFLGPHDFHDLPDIRPRLLQQAKLLSQ